MTDTRAIARLDRSSVLHPLTQLKDYASGQITPRSSPEEKASEFEDAGSKLTH